MLFRSPFFSVTKRNGTSFPNNLSTASNAGNPIILDTESDAGKAYADAVERLLGNEVPLRFVTEKKGFLSKLLGKGK